MEWNVSEIRIIRTVSEFRALEGSWNELQKRSARKNVFLTWEWVANWVDVYARAEGLLCVALYDGGDLRAVAPLCVQEERRLGANARVLRFLGSGEACADHLDFLVDAQSAPDSAKRLWREIFGRLRRDWDVFECYDVRADSLVLASFRSLERRERRCLNAGAEGESVCPYLALPDTWEEYLAQCSGTRRYAITYSMRKLAEQGALEMRFCERPDDLEASMDAFISLHQNTWRQRGWPGAFAAPEFEAFHRRVARDFLAKRVLFLATFLLDGRHIGSFYGFEYERTLYYYLLAVETNPEKRVKTGTAVIGACLQEAIRRGCREFDFLRGEEEYKYRWTAADRRNPRMRIYGGSAAGVARLISDRSWALGKSAAKRVLGKRAARLKRLVRR